ncbi:trypsin-like peptidase domain-containing protein [Falsiroseomonas sp. HW251]|uniref:trypsin-like peptidase domain-containing protein n=1 Tax=Falsiroseomonas sp. HW251 TaxID=3390998 RepID=UPI003D3238DA
MPLTYPDQDVWPNNFVVYIEVEWSDGSFTRGSGAIIGRNDVLTAAHVIYSATKQVENVAIYPAFDGAPGPWGYYDGFMEWRYFKFDVDYDYGFNTAGEAAWDMAIIGLATPLGDSTGWLGWASYAGGGSYAISGYPASLGDQLVRDTGFMGQIGFGDEALYDLRSVFASPGMSGGPIINANNQVVGVVSTSGWANRLDGEVDTLTAFMAENDQLLVPGFVAQLQFSVTYTATNKSFTLDPISYNGPVQNLLYQYIGSGSDEAIGGTARNDFINALGGRDAVNAGGGDDVVDGGLGSNFLTGGAGRDVFFLDGRSGGSTWSTITDWQSGEELSLWGFRPGVSRTVWVDNAGAAGFQGRTLHCDLNGDGLVETSVTWSGMGAGLPAPLEFDNLLWVK